MIYDSTYGASGGDVDSRIKDTPRSKVQYTTATVENTKTSRTEESTFEDQNSSKNSTQASKSILFEEQKEKTP